MSWVTVVWSMVASACLTLAAIHLLVWCRRRMVWANLFFSLTSTAIVNAEWDARLNGGVFRFEFHAVEPLARGRVRLRFGMPRGQSHLLQASGDFQIWVVLDPDRPLLNNTAFTDATVVGIPLRFYRAVKLP